MWLLLTNFLNLAMGQVFRALIIKFVVFTAIVLLIAALAVLLFGYLVNVNFAGLANLIAGLPPGLIWFLVVFQFHNGVPIVLGGLITRFAIRRIPVIG